MLLEDSDEEELYEDKENLSLEDTDDEVEVIGIKKSENTYEEDGWSTEEEAEFAGTWKAKDTNPKDNSEDYYSTDDEAGLTTQMKPARREHRAETPWRRK